MPELGRLLMLAGAALFMAGAALALVGRVPWLGRLPGDLQFQAGNSTVYIPLTTMIILSLVLTLVINLLGRLFR